MRNNRAAVLASGALLVAAAVVSCTGTAGVAAFAGSPLRTGRDLGVARQVNANGMRRKLQYKYLLKKTDDELHESIAANRKNIFNARMRKFQRKQPDRKEWHQPQYLIAAAKTILSARKNAKQAELDAAKPAAKKKPLSEEWTQEEALNAYTHFALRPGVDHSREKCSRFPHPTYARHYSGKPGPVVDDPVEEPPSEPAAVDATAASAFAGRPTPPAQAPSCLAGAAGLVAGLMVVGAAGRRGRRSAFLP